MLGSPPCLEVFSDGDRRLHDCQSNGAPGVLVVRGDGAKFGKTPPKKRERRSTGQADPLRQPLLGGCEDSEGAAAISAFPRGPG